MSRPRVQIRLISLLEEAANSFEQLETLANRTLAAIPADHVDAVEMRAVQRDIVDDDNEPGSETDHVIFIRYRTDRPADEAAGDEDDDSDSADDGEDADDEDAQG